MVAEAMIDNIADADRAEPDLHDGQLGCPWLLQADPPAGGHARPHGQPEGRDHRAADQVQLHRGPGRARVLHLDARRPQGPRRHGAAHGGLRLPDAASGRRRAGRHHPPGRLRHRGVARLAAVQGEDGRAQRHAHRAHRGRGHRVGQGQEGRGAGRPRARRSTVTTCRCSSRRSARRPTRRSRSAPCSSARRPRACARRATAARWRRAPSPRSATRSASSPRSRSASPARS